MLITWESEMRYITQKSGAWTELIAEFDRRYIWMFIKMLVKGTFCISFFFKESPEKAMLGGVEIYPETDDV